MGKSTSIYNPNIEKNPHIQRFRCMWGFQKGEDKYLNLIFGSKCFFSPKVTSGGFVLSDNSIIARFSSFIQ